MNDLKLGEIIECLDRIAKILHDKPKQALKELQELSSVIDRQVPYRDGHFQRVCEYSLRIGRHLVLLDEDMVILEMAALLHDFGKIGIDEETLLKPGLLTRSERIEIEIHVLRGYYILSGFVELEQVLKGVRNHHEHYDGSGYPNGLTQDNIPLIGRIIAVADAYDAMTSERPYRKARTKQAAIQELKRCSGEQFDPAIVKVLTGDFESILNYRCYNCWNSLGPLNINKYRTCPECNSKLSAVKLWSERVGGRAINTIEHDLLLGILSDKLTGARDIYRGKPEVIAGRKISYKPDAIYYHCKDKNQMQPIIYEVDTAYTIFMNNTGSRWKLFSETAKKCHGKFHLVIPKDNTVNNCERSAKRILKKSSIDLVEILTL